MFARKNRKPLFYWICRLPESNPYGMAQSGADRADKFISAAKPPANAVAKVALIRYNADNFVIPSATHRVRQTHKTARQSTETCLATMVGALQTPMQRAGTVMAEHSHRLACGCVGIGRFLLSARYRGGQSARCAGCFMERRRGAVVGSRSGKQGLANVRTASGRHDRTRGRPA